MLVWVRVDNIALELSAQYVRSFLFSVPPRPNQSGVKETKENTIHFQEIHPSSSSPQLGQKHVHTAYYASHPTSRLLHSPASLHTATGARPPPWFLCPRTRETKRGKTPNPPGTSRPRIIISRSITTSPPTASKTNPSPRSNTTPRAKEPHHPGRAGHSSCSPCRRRKRSP